MAANEGKYSEAEKHLSSELLSALKGELGAIVGGMKGAWDEMTKDGTIEDMEILKETKEDEPLIKEDGRWKITLG